jgi:hypothetical protein
VSVAAGRLADNIAHFARTLRAAGLPVGPGSVIDAVQAVEAASIGEKQDFYWTLHAVFVKKHEHSPLFDQAFQIFFRRRAFLEKLMAMLSPVARAPVDQDRKLKAGARRVAEAFQPPPGEAEQPKPQEETSARLTVSDADVLKAKDFAQMTTAEIAEAKALIARLELPVETVRTRRFVASPRAHRIDMRRTLRRTLRSGGASIDLAFRERAERHPPVVAICDISGSMAEYTRIFLHFLHVLAEKRRVSTFLFATRLTNVTRELRAKDPDEALAACSKRVLDWDGGTRLAGCIHDFNRDWSRRVLTQGPIVLFFSDGLERRVTGQLAFEAERLHRSCRRVVWLNPLLRFDRFEARAEGIRTLLPHVDEMRPIHNLRAMTDLVSALASGPSGKYDPKRWLGQSA